MDEDLIYECCRAYYLVYTLEKMTNLHRDIILYALFYTNGDYKTALEYLEGNISLPWSDEEDVVIIEEQINKSLLEKHGKLGIQRRIDFLNGLKLAFQQKSL
eukprot:GHVP01029847.1.p1 GENE.GHVP01029847.1~~GHVP01029847.1.p1  ORF type:complete len:102 (+),score=15.79 GHVP01029847.1:333-638(+)